MTPNSLEVLIHYYGSMEPHPRRDAPAVLSAIDEYMRDGIFEIRYEAGSGYRVTEKGRQFLEMILSTPYPEQRWIDPRNY